MGTFNQREYNAKWRAENMMRVSATYKNDFVLKFREACKELGVSQSEVIRKAMQETIEKWKGRK
ncbi:hypothetical protein [Bulleidia extructa]|uniref:hypothetical protein n=1 Tax=Bulleidia extructa TaxID=118748 RepID=UPI00235528C0|nr:hypothetical protein [Bulleidia extructa]